MTSCILSPTDNLLLCQGWRVDLQFNRFAERLHDGQDYSGFPLVQIPENMRAATRPPRIPGRVTRVDFTNDMNIAMPAIALGGRVR